MLIEQTLVLVKPSGVARGLIGEVISRMERRGLTIKVARLLAVTPEMAARHYAEHEGRASTASSSSTSRRRLFSPWWSRGRRP